MGQSQSNIQLNKNENNINYISESSSNSNQIEAYAQQQIQGLQGQHGENGQQLINTVFKWKFGGQNVCVTGSFTLWKNHIPLTRITNNEFQQIIRLPPGEHIYKFLVDGEWKFSPDDATIADENGNINNIIDTSQYQQSLNNNNNNNSNNNNNNKQQQSKQNQQQKYLKQQQQILIQQANTLQVKNQKMPSIQEWAQNAPLLPSIYSSIPFLTVQDQSNQFLNKKSFFNPNNLNFNLALFEQANKLQSPSHVLLTHLGTKQQLINSSQNSNVLVYSHRFKAKYATIKFYTFKYTEDRKQNTHKNTNNNNNSSLSYNQTD